VQYEDRVTIATPEGVDLEMTLAGLGSRFFATIIDTAIQTLLIIALVFVGTVFDGRTGGVLVGIIVVLALFVVTLGYPVVFETLASGRTPGKRWTGLRVVRAGGRPVGFLASMIRNLLRIIDFLPGSYLVGLVFVVATKKNQRLGDLAAGTLVIRDHAGGRAGRRAHKAAAAISRPTDTPLPDDLDAWDVSTITPEELATVRRFLDRRATIVAASRARLAWELAERLRPKVAGAPEDLDPEPFLEAVVTAKMRRR